ncbi:Hsp20/alpha crystallin family protein [Methylobacterium sp. J-026]|uniref:Hsp20/alpha crystallin family protein n=1 Tax=Methylobacterium sp. J-026 TaxID=2836624 RepID=UPI001FBB98B3|nr:Hsp20/alpha crystallin family protein [Methylobacterium sp. J-026]MCJ2137259.1 Hsp20/alpha crystallin family protein [Methylobacterium sp. J-026]
MSVRDLIPWTRSTGAPAAGGLAAGGLVTEPASPFPTLHREMSRLFDDGFGGFGGAPSPPGRSFGWPNLTEAEGALRVSVELPGLEETDVELLIADGVLTLRGGKRAETTDTARGCSERSDGRFERSIALPVAVQEDKAEATFRDGVLTVTLPRGAAAPERRRRIPINGTGGATATH